MEQTPEEKMGHLWDEVYSTLVGIEKQFNHYVTLHKGKASPDEHKIKENELFAYVAHDARAKLLILRNHYQKK